MAEGQWQSRKRAVEARLSWLRLVVVVGRPPTDGAGSPWQVGVGRQPSLTEVGMAEVDTAAQPVDTAVFPTTFSSVTDSANFVS